MTLEGHSECSNWSSKCPFTPKDTYRHCQHLTVAQNARPVRPFPATPPHLTRSARASSRPSGAAARTGRGGPHARAEVGRTHGPRRTSAALPSGVPMDHPGARAFSLGGHAGSAGAFGSAPAAVRAARRRRGPVATTARPGPFGALSRPFRNPARAARLRRPPRNRFGCPLCARQIDVYKRQALSCLSTKQRLNTRPSCTSS